MWVQYIAMDRHVLARMRAAPFVHVCWDNSYEIVRGVIVVCTWGGSFDRFSIYGVCSAISLCMRTCVQIDGTVLLRSIPPSDMCTRAAASVAILNHDPDSPLRVQSLTILIFFVHCLSRD